MVIHSILPVLAVGLPWIFILLMLIDSFSQETSLFSFWSVLGSLSVFIPVIVMYIGSHKGKIYFYNLTTLASKISLTFRADQLAVFFAFVASLIWLIGTIYATAIIKENKLRYFAFNGLLLSAVMGATLAENLFTFLIFWELMSIGSYPIIAHRGTVQARRAANRYLIFALLAESLIFLAILLTFFTAGTLTLSTAGILSLKHTTKGAVSLIFLLFMVGLGTKAAIMPLHVWVPDAYTYAPDSASALISGIVAGLGAFGIIRVIYNVVGWKLVKQLGLGVDLAYIAAFTIVVASIIAISQDNIKKRLAYSSISQYSYIILGAALVNLHGAIGGIIHIAYHAFMKVTLFLCAGVIINLTGNHLISKMAGIGKKLPITMVAFAIASLSMIGVPPLIGFISKWVLGVGTLDADKIFFLAVLFISAILNAVYFLPIVYVAFFREGKSHERKRLYVPTKMIAPLIITAVATVAFGIFARSLFSPYNLAVKAARSFFLVMK
jgi:multicomponent Na+:H+ antiporter subunit D